MVTWTLTDEEADAIIDCFPRIFVSNICHEGSPLHRALLKMRPTSLPTSLRYGEDGVDLSNLTNDRN